MMSNSEAAPDGFAPMQAMVAGALGLSLVAVGRRVAFGGATFYDGPWRSRATASSTLLIFDVDPSAGARP